MNNTMLATEAARPLANGISKASTWPAVNPTSMTDASARDIAAVWLDNFAVALKQNDVTRVSNLILEDGWWRDHLALSWDFRTLQGAAAISSFLECSLRNASFSNLKLKENGPFAPTLKSPVEGIPFQWLETMFSFETRLGYGSGMLRLVSSSSKSGRVWKAFAVYTALAELKGFPEATGDLRPHGGDMILSDSGEQIHWEEQRQRQLEFVDSDPDVLCIGAGQSGLNLGARLQAIGVSCLIIDRNRRIGDNWRCRYKSLVTHDPVQYTHMAYLPFPANWPLFTPKDKLADWFENYASIMELNVWTSTNIVKASYDDEAGQWTITMTRNGEERILKPKHVVFCTGHAGEAKVPSFPEQSSFEGQVYHAMHHTDASDIPDVTKKRVIVVGTGNSGHDIAQNFYERGAADVTMLQRQGTYVLSSRKGLFMLHEGMYDQMGPPTEIADVVAQSLPNAIQFKLNIGLTERIKAAEQQQVDGLEKAGFQMDYAPDGSGIYRKYITRGGGYYIDVGASQLIIDGKIKIVHSSDGIRNFTPDALVLADGRQLKADIVVLATGYDNMRTSAAKALGKKEANRCRDVWDLDEEGEVNAMWRPSGHPGIWFMGGSLALCRVYSKFLALQLKASLEGLS